MGKTLSDLAPNRGARHKRKRLGRGPGSGRGTTGGKGQKGQLSRSGVTLGRSFEGGQMPLNRRLPKFGFKNLFRVEYAAVNVGRIAATLSSAHPPTPPSTFEAGETVDPEWLKAHGLAPRSATLVKVLGSGQVTRAITVRAHAFSRAAKEKIEAAGGTVEVVPAPGRSGPTTQTSAERSAE